MPMLSIGIDVSKGKSTVCGMKPGEKIVYTPFEVSTRGKGCRSWFRRSAQRREEVASVSALVATIARV